MTDWFSLFANSLWILGLSLLLTALSLAQWLAAQQEQSLRRTLKEPSFRLTIAVSFMLFALGLTLVVDPWWYKLGWIVIFTLSLWEGFVAQQDLISKTE